MRPHAIPETVATSHVRDLFSGFSDQTGTTVEDWLDEMAGFNHVLNRLPTLAEVAEFATFAASDRGGAMTGTVANLSAGTLVG
jgi:hypothetical protein